LSYGRLPPVCQFFGSDKGDFIAPEF